MLQKNNRIAVLASGSGTNAERIFLHFKDHPDASVVLLLCNRADAYVLVRAHQAGVPHFVFDRAGFEGGQVLERLQTDRVTHIVLAGFLWLMPASIINAYAGRIINIHPALLPAFGGKGMYGMRVHEAVKAAGMKETGITIHEVNERYDEGKILFQASCAVQPNDTPETIAEHVHQLEYQHYPEVIERWLTETQM
jgi:phosphoribosylglycinamide formyltransferase-1